MSAWIQQEQSKLFERLGVFFAFSKAQLEEQRVAGVEYVTVLGSGDCVPKEHAKEFAAELTRIHKEGRERKLAEMGIDKIIEYELSNHECFYTGEIDDALDALEGYGVTAEQVWKVFHAIKHQYED